jgi:hypothetical protein
LSARTATGTRTGAVKSDALTIGNQPRISSLIPSICRPRHVNPESPFDPSGPDEAKWFAGPDILTAYISQCVIPYDKELEAVSVDFRQIVA